MDSIGIEIKGLKELDVALRSLGAELGAKTLRSALRDAAKPFHESMLSNAPVGKYESRIVKLRSGSTINIQPGFTKSRVKIRASLNRKGQATKKFSDKTAALVRVGAFRVPYIVPLEYGTSKMPASGFIRGALSQQDRVLSIFRERLARRIELARKRVARNKAKK